MFIYAIRRLLYTIPIGLGVTTICFALVYLAPGDPIQSLLPPDASEEDAVALKKAYGLDKPIPVQYVLWLMKALQGTSEFPSRPTNLSSMRSSARLATPSRSR